jgi:hypothetical protein
MEQAIKLKTVGIDHGFDVGAWVGPWVDPSCTSYRLRSTQHCLEVPQGSTTNTAHTGEQPQDQCRSFQPGAS